MMPNSNALRALAAELAMSRAMIDDKATLVSARRQEAQQSSAEAHIIALAYEVHNFYGLCEQTFERIRSVFAVPVSRPDRYHEELLNQMALDIPEVRPAVISTEFKQRLDEFRRFHHVFRHAYVAQFDRQRVLELAGLVAPMAQAITEALEQFRAHLLELADRLDAAG
ncbi:MAG: hypothetical protein HY314_01905 [Acidobacteria bacterium]|nr:hypothetical protein [Acidobacteriota bacterium]